MARVALAEHVDEGTIATSTAEAEATAEGAVETRAVFRDAERPLWLWRHRLAPGARLTWDRPGAGHCVYLWEGSATVNGAPLGRDGTVFVEHNGRATVEAGAEGAVLLDFHRAAGQPAPDRPGGHVHIVPDDGQVRPERRSRQVYLDATCPTCTLWLHKTNFPVAYRSSAHYHTADEIILVLRGEMRLGNRGIGRGGAIAIDKDTRYGFETGEDGLCFINFRPTESYYIQFDENNVPREPRLER